MESPEKYKSIPVTNVYNRTLTQLSAEQKIRLKTIIENFIKYLKLKHS